MANELLHGLKAPKQFEQLVEELSRQMKHMPPEELRTLAILGIHRKRILDELARRTKWLLSEKLRNLATWRTSRN